MEGQLSIFDYLKSDCEKPNIGDLIFITCANNVIRARVKNLNPCEKYTKYFEAETVANHEIVFTVKFFKNKEDAVNNIKSWHSGKINYL